MIDPRGPRTAAWITTVVLAVVLLTGSALLLAVQAVVFASGVRGASPYGVVFRRLVRPRLGPPAELEPEAPVRTAQLVGLVVATVGIAGALAGSSVVLAAAAGLALAAAFLNAAFGLCLGCELHLLIRRTTHRTTTPQTGAPA